jgi:hydroxymethylbilane synthase
VKLGTRGSPLALWQAERVRALLVALHPGLEVEVVAIRTRAERFPERAIAEIGTGVFSRELDEALTSGAIDLAVHSLKDLPSAENPELSIAAVPERESPLDAWVSRDGARLDELPAGARVATGSPRRRAQLLARRPDLEVVPIRGNVDTRLRKLGEEGLAATVLAHAGLKRLGREDAITELLPPELMVPAVGQGALAVVVRRGDAAVEARVAPLDHGPSRQRVAAERSFLRKLRGGCQAPAGALATLAGEGSDAELTLDAVLATPDGATCLRARERAPARHAEEIGERAAAELLAGGGEAILAGIRSADA